jgi:hypothetical protein
MTVAVAHVMRRTFVLASLGVLAVSAGVLAGVAAMAWLPAQSRQAEAQARTAQLLTELKELKLRQDMAALYLSRAGEVDTLEKKLKLARSEPEFVAEIEKLATASPAQLLQFSSRAAPKGKPGTDSTVFEFFLKGDYAGLKAFIAGLSGLPEFLTVERVVFERVEPAVRARVLIKRHTDRGP